MSELSLAATPQPFSLPPISLYRGKVMHARLKPMSHRFFYNVFSILIDLDRLEEAKKAASLFSVNRFNLISFFEKDHGPRNGSPLRSYVDEICRKTGVESPARVLLSAFPRVMGYVFNPLSVYFLYNAKNRIYAHLYEVKNTFGGMHTYVEELPEQGSASHCAKKLFHVSPFLPKELHYHFTVLPPSSDLRLRIVEKDEAGDTILTALYNAKIEDVSNKNLLKEGIALPFASIKIIAGIHWEALKLFIKGARLLPDFKRPSHISHNDSYLSEQRTEQDRIS